MPAKSIAQPYSRLQSCHSVMRFQIICNHQGIALGRSAAYHGESLTQAAGSSRRRFGCTNDEVGFRLILIGRDQIIIDSDSYGR